jgi:hypothetical protein
MTREAERRPGKGGAQKMHMGDGITLRVQRDCPLVRAAVRLRDPAALAAVRRWHPPSRCPAARRQRAA